MLLKSVLCSLILAACVIIVNANMLFFMPKDSLTAQSNYVICPDKRGCDDNMTCCLLKSGIYGCCPWPSGSCCDDQEHCCPFNYTCDMKRFECIPRTGNGTRLTSIVDSKIMATAQCPDGSQCADSATCCQLSGGGYGCCPYPQAVCCSDQEHCCPNGYTCDLQQQTCNKGLHSIPFSSPLKSLAVATVNDVPCDDKSSCPDGETCCQLASGSYGCCPYPQAVCCSDQEHCCPNGYTCDLQQQTCNKGLHSIPFGASLKSLATVDDVDCPDGSKCDDGTTCCHLAAGGYGCCPYPQAVCCSDHQHCCPNGYTCNIKQQTCDKGFFSIPFTSPLKSLATVSDVKCDDGSACPDGTTCCQLASGSYGCCPYPQAVCCSDHQHCCPNGYTCNLQQQMCNKGFFSIPFTSPLKSLATVSDVKCVDGSACADGTTCCQLVNGSYACCPYAQGVCCSDHQHCCPNGYTCNMQKQMCDKGLHSIPFTSPLKSLATVSDVKCDDGSACADGTTCCQLVNGSYACCPYPQGVCCSDHHHCCPTGYTCNMQKQMCDKGLHSLPFSSPLKSLTTVSDVKCDDGSACPDGATCCQLASGSYGCCPYPQAVCCSDHLHCCPNGYTCNLQAQTCDQGSLKIPFSSPLESNSAIVNDVPCPGGESSCPDSTTCCMMANKQYGCCPLPNAVCCDDHQHCCPNGYTCDTGKGTCLGPVSSIPWSVKMPAKPTVKPATESDCQCLSGNTCCQQKCCPFENAMCCGDGIHCCPAGTSCDAKSNMCRSLSSSLMFSWQEMNKQKMLVTIDRSIICPDQSQCDSGDTCCQMASGTYGCCPLDQAVCCSDKLHCCPHGTQCDVEHSRCIDPSGVQLPWDMHGRLSGKP